MIASCQSTGLSGDLCSLCSCTLWKWAESSRRLGRPIAKASELAMWFFPIAHPTFLMVFLFKVFRHNSQSKLPERLVSRSVIGLNTAVADVGRHYFLVSMTQWTRYPVISNSTALQLPPVFCILFFPPPSPRFFLNKRNAIILWIPQDFFGEKNK